MIIYKSSENNIKILILIFYWSKYIFYFKICQKLDF